MPGDFWLIDFQNFDEETHAYFVFADEINQSQTRPVSQCGEEELWIEFGLNAHNEKSTTFMP